MWHIRGPSLVHGHDYMRIGRAMARLLESGWRPLTDISDLLLWDPRDYNSVADHGANVALDLGQEWQILRKLESQHAIAAGANIRLCFDGALRGNGSAAGGLEILAYYPDGSRVSLCRSGCLFQGVDSAFQAEVQTLEWCLHQFEILVHADIL